MGLKIERIEFSKIVKTLTNKMSVPAVDIYKLLWNYLVFKRSPAPIDLPINNEAV